MRIVRRRQCPSESSLRSPRPRRRRRRCRCRRRWGNPCRCSGRPWPAPGFTSNCPPGGRKLLKETLARIPAPASISKRYAPAGKRFYSITPARRMGINEGVVSSFSFLFPFLLSFPLLVSFRPWRIFAGR